MNVFVQYKLSQINIFIIIIIIIKMLLIIILLKKLYKVNVHYK